MYTDMEKQECLAVFSYEQWYGCAYVPLNGKINGNSMFFSLRFSELSLHGEKCSMSGAQLFPLAAFMNRS